MLRRLVFPRNRSPSFFERRRQGQCLETLAFEVGRRAVAFGGEQGLDARALALELDAATLAFGGERLIHVFAQTRRGVRGRLLQLGAELGGGCGRGLFHLAADLVSCLLPGGFSCLFSCLLAHPLGRLGRRLLHFAADAVGLGDQLAVGLGGRVREPRPEPSLPFLAKRLGFLAMPLGSLARGLRQRFDFKSRLLRLESRSLAVGGQPTFGVRRGVCQPRLQASVPLVANGVDFCRPDFGGLRFGLASCVFALFCEPIHHLGGLGLEIGLQPRTKCVDRGTKIVIGHFSDYRDGARASQASAFSGAGVQTQRPQ